MLKHFTDVNGNTIAVNPIHVMTVTEFQFGKPKTSGVIIGLTSGEKIMVVDRFDHVFESIKV